MIERMKKITLLVSEKEKEGFIARLRKAGILHVKHIKVPSSHEITFVEDRMAKIDNLVSVLSPFAEKGRGKEERTICREKEIAEFADEVIALSRERRECLAGIRGIKSRMEWFEAWGSFDPRDLAVLKEKGIVIRLYCLTKKEYRRIRREKGHYVISASGGYVYAAAVFPDAEGKLPFREVVPPPEGPEAMKKEMEKLDGKLSVAEETLRKKSGALESLRECRKALDREHEFLSVKSGMREEGRFSCLQGFCPAGRVKRITSMARRYGLGYLIEDPDEAEEVPTLITNPGWIRIIDPVFRFMNTLPGYNEFDISFYFLVFFSLFFAMLIGDAGYGLLFFLVTFLARRRFGGLPPEPFFLMYVLSCGTVVWGAVTGTWFGAEKIAELPFFSSLVVERINSFTASNQNFMIFICFIIGAAHLTVAHLLRGARVINSPRALAEAGWVMILWGMFFAAGKLVIGRAFPAYAWWLLGAGMVFVLLFSNPRKGVLKGVLSTLANLPLSVISSFSDVVSYLRLFAVGYATVILAKSFNDMAVAGGVSGARGAFIAAFILFLGHLLNIVLGFMAVIVHGIRLNMLEFSGHLGMQWSGRKYEPFCE